MGVPKFFRWLSERYPLINQRYHAPYDQPPSSSKETSSDSDDSDSDYPSKNQMDVKALQHQMTHTNDLLQGATLAPVIDRLYIDMNGIIHGCSHNNSEEDGSTTTITHEEIFDNITVYLDRVIGEIAQPRQLVYMAIDGVAPRAKLNQQRSRRYRSNTGMEIEQTVYDAHMDKMAKERREDDVAERLDEHYQQQVEENKGDLELDDPVATALMDEMEANMGEGGTLLTEVEPGRFTGKFETHVHSESAAEQLDFHSNSITPGTPFFKECTDHLEQYIRDKLAHDPKWKHLTIIFSGPNVPGEGEHKIMDFMRQQKQRPDYDPNLRHCIQGQDGDLIMLGLVTHEPNLVLLREQVIFDARRRVATQGMGVEAYVHNPNFEFLHMNVLRDYLAFDLETSNVVAHSPFDLERTIDDFVFMTFFVGNDFLPPMPALDIADEAFDLLWYAYREHRQKWHEEAEDGGGGDPYLTNAGTIVCGKRLEEFLMEVGSFESPYFDNKKEVEKETNERIRKADLKFGNETIPDDNILEAKEEADRAQFREMMKERREALKGAADGFDVVLSSKDEAFDPSETFQPSEESDKERLSPGLSKRLGNLLKQSVAEGALGDEEDTEGILINDTDVKGRYYYDKFKFTPFDAAEHKALRHAYIEGLVWTLKYYYEGCVSWSWYYPYHYGPMLSDLAGIDKMLKEVTFEGRLGEPLMPFEQLMACMPPSQAHVLPEVYRPLMTEADSSPIIDFYPKAFTVDMNGKRWPWEAVVLLPFIDTQRLLECTRSISDDVLTEEERDRNSRGEVAIMSNASLDGSSDAIKVEQFESSEWDCEMAGFQPALQPGIQIPLPGLPTLRTAPIRSMWRRKMGLNVFGQKSRYKTACLEHSESMPVLPPLDVLGQSLIGTTVWINFPHLTEAFVTAVSNESYSMRGTEGKLQPWDKKDKMAWVVRRDDVVDAYERGQGFTGTGGLIVNPDQDVLLSVRPLKELKTRPDGTVAKKFLRQEIEVPIVATLWSPTEVDPRLGVPALLEKDPFKFYGDDAAADLKQTKKYNSYELPSEEPKKAKKGKKKSASTLLSAETITGVTKALVKEVSLSMDSILPAAPEPINGLPSPAAQEASILPDSNLTKKSKAKASARESKKGNGERQKTSTPDWWKPKKNGERRASVLDPAPPAKELSKPKKNGEKQASVLAFFKEGKEMLNDDKRRASVLGFFKEGKERLNGDIGLFPSTPSHKDVWLRIEPEEFEIGASTEILLPDTSASVEAGVGATLAKEKTTEALKVVQATNQKWSKEKTTEVVKVVSATNQKWWETDTYKQGAPVRKFSTLSRPAQSRIGPMPSSRRQFSTLASKQKSLVQGRGRAVVAGVAAAAFLFSGANAATFGIEPAARRTVAPFVQKLSGAEWMRGGSTNSWIADDNLHDSNDDETESNVPPLEFLHGTTTLSFSFQGGAIVAVDSRASMGSFVGSKTVQKVLPINSHMLGTMAGGAADCSWLMRLMRSEAMVHELEHQGRRISTARVSNLLARLLYDNRGSGLSVGTMIVGYDDLPKSVESTPQIYYVDDNGTRLKGKLFSAGSGSTFALAILDTEFQFDMTVDEAVSLGIKAIRYATLRDAYSGGFINVFVVTRDGWKKVFTEDVAVVHPVGNETIAEES